MPLDYAIAQRVLPNGLRVVVNEDRSVPNVAVNLWVNVGSRHEKPGKTGFAHLFEHLMFQGSRHVASGEHFAVLMSHGGRINATTWFDRTNYFQTVPTGAYELALWMEADRHAFLLDALTQENLDNQRDVVKEEKRQRYDNVPYGNAMIRLFATLFPPGHPYHHPTIGSMEDLDAATLQDVHSFFTTYYHPGNTVLSLVGDLTPQEGFDAAHRYFGAIPAAPIHQPPPTPPLSPLSEPVYVEVREDVPIQRLYLGFRLPQDNTTEYFAASCALDVLAGLSSARLERLLVRERELCHTVSSGSTGLIDGVSAGTIAVELADEVEAGEVLDVVGRELESFAAQGPTGPELEAVLAQTERCWLSGLASMDERADYLSHFATLFGDPAGINTWLDRVSALTAQDLATAAAQWLTPSAQAVVHYRKDAVA